MKLFLVGACVLTAAVAQAQVPNGKPKPVAVPALLKNYADTLSYALGMNVASGLQQQGITAIKATWVRRGMEDFYSKRKTLVSPQDGGACVQRLVQTLSAKKALPPANAKAPATQPLKSLLDSSSYAIGYNVAGNIERQQFGTVNVALVCRALEAASNKKPTLLNSDSSNQIVQKHMQTLYEKLQASANQKVNAEKAKGDAFLEANKKRPGVITTASGLQYEVLRRGDSTSAKPKPADKFVAHYAGTLIDGTEFDNSYKRGTPLTLGVTQVIPGWTEALQLMHIGDKFKIYLPSSLGYGDRGAGAGIPGGATLVFEMELLGIEK
jgi:FKBP-type peptidyl-prolyl cis-trans isomerase FklB